MRNKIIKEKWYNRVKINQIPLWVIFKKNFEKYILHKAILQFYLIALYSACIFVLLSRFWGQSWWTYLSSVGIYFIYKEFVADIHSYGAIKKR